MQTVDSSSRTQPKEKGPGRQAGKANAIEPPGRHPRGSMGFRGRLGADAGADGAELAGSALAQEGDGHDADHGDQGHEQCVLDEAGAALVRTHSGTDIGQAELPPVLNDGHVCVPCVRWAVVAELRPLRAADEAPFRGSPGWAHCKWPVRGMDVDPRCSEDHLEPVMLQQPVVSDASEGTPPDSWSGWAKVVDLPASVENEIDDDEAGEEVADTVEDAGGPDAAVPAA